MIERHPAEFDHQGTLCYIFDDQRVLLIWKKRGIGKGQYNGPGGKIEPQDRSPYAGARREVHEEIAVAVDRLEPVGQLAFIFGDQPFMYGYIFATDQYEGEPTETPEAKPEWFDIDELPYDQMWADDRYWMPKMLAGDPFHGTFYFDDDGEVLVDRALSFGFDPSVEPQLSSR